MNVNRLIPTSILSLLVLVSPALAETVTSNRGATLNGPNGILVSLGFENVTALTASQVAFFYTVVGVGLLMILAAFSSERQSRFYGILLPIMAAMFATFGWLNSAGNPWPMIVTAAFLGVVFYFKDTLMERWGSGGPGTTLMNIAVLLIIFQAMVSAVNAAAIFGSMTVGSSANTFGAIDASSEITKISNMGGATDPLVAVATFLTQVLPAALMAIVSVLIGLACFSAVLLAIWPGLGDSGLVLALLGVFQLIIYIVYIKAFYDIARGNAWALDF